MIFFKNLKYYNWSMHLLHWVKLLKKPATFFWLSQNRTWISNFICHGLFLCSMIWVGYDCSFSWYWWSCWPLFYFSFPTPKKYLFIFSFYSDWYCTTFLCYSYEFVLFCLSHFFQQNISIILVILNKNCSFML
jgi:hypothetical protein